MNNAYVSAPVYRTARDTDLEKIASIEKAVFAEPYLFLMLRQLFDLHGTDWLVAELDDEVIGYALVLEKGGRALLFTFAVAEHLQHQGYGRTLLARALQHCRRAGAQVMYLTVRPDNLRAANIFKEAGFAVVEHDDQYFGAGAPRYVLECPLQKVSA